MKTLNLSILFATLTVATLVGCGGGSGGGITAAPAGATTTSATITPYKGPFYAGATVVLKDASGNPVTLTSGGTVNASGVINVSYPTTVSYPLIVEVTGKYYNEITGKAETTTVPLRGLITSATGASSVPVTLVTETAVTDLQNRLGTFSAAKPILPASAVAALTAAGNMLGIPASAVPVFDPVTNKTGDADTLRLAAMAVIANGQVGATLVDKIKALASSLVASTTAPTGLISPAAYSAALTAMTSGASSVMAAGTIAPTPSAISTSSYASLYAAAGGGAVTPLATSPAASACTAAGGMWDPLTNTCLSSVTNLCPTGQVLNPLNVCVAASSVPGVATTPKVTSFSPSTGAVGTVVTITGTNLGLGFQPAPIVKFGTTAVTTPLTFNGQTSISFAVPTGLAAGAHTITIGGMTGVPLTVGTFTVTAVGGVTPGVGLSIAPAFKSAAAFADSLRTTTITPAIGGAQFQYRQTSFDPVVAANLAEDFLDITHLVVGAQTTLSISINVGAPMIGIPGATSYAMTQIACDLGVTTGKPTCASLGVVFDRVAGKLTFTNTPFVYMALATTHTVNGTLNFAPF